jgi:hypothetical protein
MIVKRRPVPAPPSAVRRPYRSRRPPAAPVQRRRHHPRRRHSQCRHPHVVVAGVIVSGCVIAVDRSVQSAKTGLVGVSPLDLPDHCQDGALRPDVAGGHLDLAAQNRLDGRQRLRAAAILPHDDGAVGLNSASALRRSAGRPRGRPPGLARLELPTPEDRMGHRPTHHNRALAAVGYQLILG